VLEHREDQEAFYKHVDKLHAEATWVDMPALQSAEDLESHPEFLEPLRKSAERYGKAF
jgi:hypothetical protein